MPLENLVDERAMRLRNRRDKLLLELDRIDLAHALVLPRDDDIDAVRLVSDLRIDPLEFVLELRCGVGQSAEHSKAARLGNGRDHVPAMAERKNRKLDPQSIAKLGMHRDCSPERRVLTPDTKIVSPDCPACASRAGY